VIRRIPRTSNTTTITVADINGPASGNVKVATFFVRPNLATLTSVAVSKWSWATVGFNATVSNTSFTITLNNNKILNWVDVSAAVCKHSSPAWLFCAVNVLLKQMHG
jgi:hypothetical protein